MPSIAAKAFLEQQLILVLIDIPTPFCNRGKVRKKLMKHMEVKQFHHQMGDEYRPVLLYFLDFIR